MEETLLKIKELLALYGLNVLGAIVILIIGVFAAKLIRASLRRLMGRARVDETLISFVSSLSYIVILIFVAIAVLGRLGIHTASFVAILASAGLAIGLALQSSLSSFAAGVMMIIFKPFKVDDYIEGGGVAGSVVSIGVFTTELKSPDNRKILVPNNKIVGDNIVNFNARKTRRIEIVVGVSYHDDIDKVKAVLTRLIESDSRVLKDPAPLIAVLALAENSVNFAVRPWVKASDYWDLFFFLQENIKKQFDLEGITIPFPQQDVHVRQIEK